MLHLRLRHRPPLRLVADSGKEIEDFKLSFGFCGSTVHGQLLLTSRSIDPRRVTPLVVETRFWRPIKVAFRGASCGSETPQRNASASRIPHRAISAWPRTCPP